MEFANRLAKYEPDILDSASQPWQGWRSADLQLGHAWVINSKSDIPKSVFPADVMVNHVDTSLLALLSCSWKSISQLAISSTRKAIFGLPPFASCLAPSWCHWLYCNPIHALQFFYFATGLQAAAFEYWHHAQDISSYVFGRDQNGHSLLICAGLHHCILLRGQNLSVEFVWWISMTCLDKWPHGLSHLLLGLTQEGFMQQGDATTPCLLAPKRLFKFCSKSVERIFISFTQPPNIPTHTNAPVNNSACCWTFIFNAN